MNIPGYRIIRELSRGGVATVFLAVQEILEREVVLKVMSSTLPEDPPFKEALLHEGKIIEKLRHPHIITLYGLGYAAGRYYIVMEYVSGKSLKERIQESLTFKQSLEITIRIARALHYVHKHGIIHRDIKPSNILLRGDECPVLTDFGLATLHAASLGLRRDSAFIGTPRYVSPERVKGTPEDARSDLYSLGAMFYEMLTGTPPYVGEDALATTLRHVRDPVPELPEPVAFLQPVLNGLMAKDPAHRFRGAEEFIQALAQVMHDRSEQKASLILEPMQALLDRRPVRAIDESRARMPSKRHAGTLKQDGRRRKRTKEGHLIKRRPIAIAALTGFLVGTLLLSILLRHFGSAFGITIARSVQDEPTVISTNRWPLEESVAQNGGDAVLRTPPAPERVPPPRVENLSRRVALELSAEKSTEMLQELRKRDVLVPVQGADRKDLKTSFHEARGDRVHEAIDILAPRNTPVLAVEDGTVAKLYYSDRGGITLYQFDPEKNYVYYYAHLEKYADHLKEGDRLKKGQVVGYVGTSGSAPKDTPHLHFAIVRLNEDKHWWEGNPIDPYLVFGFLKFDPGDGKLQPSETDDLDPESLPKEKQIAPAPTPAPSKPEVELKIRMPPPAWAGHACGEANMRCDHAKHKFQDYELPFSDLDQGTQPVHSRPFYAVMLGSAPVVSDDGDPNKTCGGQFSESERQKHQQSFPNHKVFASRNSCTNERVTYTNVNQRFNFIAVYAGSKRKDGDAMLRYVKSLGKYNGPNVRKMQVQLRVE